MRVSIPQTTPLAAALVAALFAPVVSAAPILGAASTAEAPIGTPGSTSPYADANTASSSSFASSGLNSAYGNAFARDNGAYASSTGAQGNGQSSGSASFTTEISNNSGFAQHYYLTLKIYGGYIGTYLNDSTLGALVAGESLVSAYSAVVKVGASTAFSSSATLTRDSGGISMVRSGTVLTGADDPLTDIADGYYNWGGDYYSIDLGVVADGASVTVQALLDGSSYANVGTYDFSNGNGSYGYGYGYGCYAPSANTAVSSLSAVIAECQRVKGGANEFYGDPQDVDAVFQISSTRVDGNVPEPAPLALVGLGVAAAGWSRRRRNKPE